jgi:hypothetical protein
MQQEMTETNQLHPWKNARTDFERVHMDCVCPFGVLFVVTVCDRSKLPETEDMGDFTFDKKVNVLTNIFSRNHISNQLVSNNDVQFISYLFSQFMKKTVFFILGLTMLNPSKWISGPFENKITLSQAVEL